MFIELCNSNLMRYRITFQNKHVSMKNGLFSKVKPISKGCANL